jgi:hypothetical protein
MKSHAERTDRRPAKNPAVDPQRNVATIIAGKNTTNGIPATHGFPAIHGFSISRNAVAMATIKPATRWAFVDSGRKRGRSIYSLLKLITG